MKNTDLLFDFIKKSPTAYQAVKSVCEILDTEGYEELYESDKWKLTEGKKYYVVRNGTSLIAFRTVKKLISI